MIKSRFDAPVERRNTNSLKWDVKENELPMWVADMDFETAPEIKEEVLKTAQLGVYGYSIVPEAYFSAVQSWWRKRHHVELDTSWMIYCTGVVAAISSIINKITTPGENVVIQSPVYNIFYNCILNHGRNVLSSDLIYNNGVYEVDFSDLEKKLANPQTSLMILCNPHNPIGHIWSKEELQKIGALCKKYHVTVVSDEIHCDITDPGYEYVPFLSASEDHKDFAICCFAASKTFNLAGLQSAFIVVPNPHLRHKVYRGINTDEVGEPNVFAIPTNIAAYTKGELWVDELRQYLYDNKCLWIEALKSTKAKVVEGHATYLLWVDISAYSKNSVTFTNELREKTGLYLCDGAEYGKNGSTFVRINYATQRVKILEGIDKFIRFIQNI